MSTLNQDLVRHDQPEKFVGLLCARLEIRTGRLWVSNAGLTPPLIRRAAGAFSEVLSGGVLLGVSPSASYPDALVELDAGDLVVVYTDGLTEARCGEELFGTERVSAVLDRAHDRRAADILEELLAEVRSFADRPLDDVTVVVLKQLTRPATAKNGVKTPVQNSPAPADAVG
jgi:sigma-B regulation protein RsbU (phosphoserine phosphatase)